MAHQGIRVGRRGRVEESRRPCNICAAFPGPPLGPAKEVRTMSHRDDGTLTRRGFLIATGAAVSIALQPRRAATQQAAPPAPPVPGKERLIMRSPRPINLETGLADLTSYYTPEELFFVRNNYDAAPVDPALWALKIEGEIDNPVLLRLDDLKRLSVFAQDVTLECAGNGRAFHKPRASGIQWEYGAVGTQAWRGVRLADVLALAKPRASAQHVHGGPARVIVPGFVGSASIKWVERIMLLTEEFNGFYMKSNYTAPRADSDKEVYSLQSLEAKSIIVGPADGARLQPGRVTMWGWAWSGEGELTGIDVSTDGGQTWSPGKFVGKWDRYSWRKWEYDWDATAGTRTLMARATDSLGRVQPTSRAWNRLGYRWNVIHAVRVDVA